jgi:hypothetical protein
VVAPPVSAGKEVIWQSELGHTHQMKSNRWLRPGCRGSHHVTLGSAYETIIPGLDPTAKKAHTLLREFGLLIGPAGKVSNVVRGCEGIALGRKEDLAEKLAHA